MKLLELWSADAKTKKHPPEGLFGKGSATEIAAWLKKSHEDLKGAMSALNFYKNRAGKNLSDGQKAKLEHAKALLHSHFTKKDEKKEEKKPVKESLIVEGKLKDPKTLTAQDWELYFNSEDIKPAELNAACKDLNAALVKALQQKTAKEAWAVMTPVMKKHQDTGSYDTEPRAVAGDYFNQKFEDYDHYDH